MGDLASTLVRYNFAHTEEDAQRLCERGSVRLNGRIVSNSQVIPECGSTLTTLEPDAYTVWINNPDTENNT